MLEVSMLGEPLFTSSEKVLLHFVYAYSMIDYYSPTSF